MFEDCLTTHYLIAAVRYRGDRNPPRYGTTAIEIRRGTVPRRLKSTMVRYHGDQNPLRYGTAAIAFLKSGKNPPRYRTTAIEIRRGAVPRRSKSAAVPYRGGSNRTAVDQVPNFGALLLTLDDFFHQKAPNSTFLMLVATRIKF